MLCAPSEANSLTTDLQLFQSSLCYWCGLSNAFDLKIANSEYWLLRSGFASKWSCLHAMMNWTSIADSCCVNTLMLFRLDVSWSSELLRWGPRGREPARWWHAWKQCNHQARDPDDRSPLIGYHGDTGGQPDGQPCDSWARRLCLRVCVCVCAHVLLLYTVRLEWIWPRTGSIPESADLECVCV